MELSDDQSTHTANDEYGRLNPNSLLGGLFFVVSLVFLFYVIPNYINLPPYMQHPLLSPHLPIFHSRLQWLFLGQFLPYLHVLFPNLLDW